MPVTVITPPPVPPQSIIALNPVVEPLIVPLVTDHDVIVSPAPLVIVNVSLDAQASIGPLITGTNTG